MEDEAPKPAGTGGGPKLTLQLKADKTAEAEAGAAAVATAPYSLFSVVEHIGTLQQGPSAILSFTAIGASISSQYA